MIHLRRTMIFRVRLGPGDRRADRSAHRAPPSEIAPVYLACLLLWPMAPFASLGAPCISKGRGGS